MIWIKGCKEGFNVSGQAANMTKQLRFSGVGVFNQKSAFII